MHFRITSDTNAESGVGEVVTEISGATREHFASKAYGAGLSGLCVVLMCRDPELKFKQRIRFAKKERRLYMDVMLDLERMVDLSHDDRRRLVAAALEDEVPAALHKYAFPEFDYATFVADLQSWLGSIRGEDRGVVPAA
jgi:hypothetical protein